MDFATLDSQCAHVPGLAKRLMDFYTSFFNEDYDGCLLLTYPRIFNLMPKEAMRQKLMETFHNPDMDIHMDLVTIDKVGQVIEHEEGRFVKIDYTVLMAISFTEDKEGNSTKKKARGKKEFLLKAFEAQYGKKNIWYEETTKSYCFHVSNHMAAIEDSDSPKWTFLTLKKGPMMEVFLPDDIRVIFESDMG
jgi:hypothetical protein